MEVVNERNNFIYLTLSLLLLLLVSAVSHSVPGEFNNLIFLALEVFSLGLAYISLDFSPRLTRLLKGLLALLLVSSALGDYFAWRLADTVTLIVVQLFFLSATWEAARKVLLSDTVQINVILGSLSVYLLLGLVWANLYLIVLQFVPTAFNGIAAADWAENFPDVVYFSFVTMTSLGYGEITPNIPIARVLAFLEAIAGTFYMAVVVASLISAHSKTRKA